MKLLRMLEKSQLFFLFVLGTIFFFLRFPSLFEPYWYGDEGIYFVIGDALRDGRILYNGIWDNKPPFLYFLYQFFGQDIFNIKLLSLLFGLGGTVCFYFLSKKFLTSKGVILATGLFIFLFGTPALEGTIANAENFMLFPILLAFVCFFRVFSFQGTKIANVLSYIDKRYLFISGILFGISFLFKIVGGFDLFALFFFIFLISYNEKRIFNNTLRTYSLYILPGFITPLFLYSIFASLQGNFVSFIKATFLDNVSYVGLENSFVIPHGILIFKTVLLALCLYGIFYNRNKIPVKFLFILTWLTVSLFNVFFSQRPYGHYLLLLLPSFVLFVVSSISYPKFKKRIYFATFFLIVFLGFTFRLFLIPKTIPYYGNFLSFAVGAKSPEAYFSFFDRKTPRDYAIATFIKSHAKTREDVYIWGDSAQTYFLADSLPPGRYSVSYHIAFSETARVETDKLLERKQPKYIIIMPDTLSFPFSLSLYEEKMRIDGVIIYERIY